MNKAILAFTLSAAIIMSGLSCSRRGERIDSNREAETSLESPRGTGRDAPGRRGGGPRLGQGGGRGKGRILESSGPLQLSKKQLEAIELQTAEASYKPMTSDLQANGKILAHQLRKAIVSYPFPARIAQIHVRPGDWVNKGQELVTLQSEAVGEAKSAYFKALADAELAGSNYERAQRLFERGAGAGKNLQAAEAERKVAEASLEAAEKKLHILGFSENQVRRAKESHEINPLITLFSPIAGKVLSNEAVLGGMVDQSSEILTILDPSLVCVDADIYERDIAKVRIGQEAEVTVPAHPGLVSTGKIKYIGDTLNEETRTITVRTEVANKDGRLKPGMFASLRIILDRQSRALVLPETAVLDDGDQKICFVREEGEFHLRLIETGIKFNGFIEVISGVDEGEEVVTTGSYQLKSKLYDEIVKESHIH
jgi:cobalt-zinc-cadmium efflux system membrane fusion protein